MNVFIVYRSNKDAVAFAHMDAKRMAALHAITQIATVSPPLVQPLQLKHFRNLRYKSD